MVAESWLPIAFALPDGALCGRVVHADSDWQIVETRDGGRALIAKVDLANRWVAAGLINTEVLHEFSFGALRLRETSCPENHQLAPVAECRSPESKEEALSFAMALRATRGIDEITPLQDALYVEHLDRLLPCYGISSRTPDDVILGYWLTGGAHVSAKSFRRLAQMLSWIGVEHLREVVLAAGFDVSAVIPPERLGATPSSAQSEHDAGTEVEPLSAVVTPLLRPFELPGRPELAQFFNEHVVDVVRNLDRYTALGVGFPSAIILHGPPGCGKSFAIDRLVEYLGWPSFQIEASSIASPFIHETSKKIANVFERAMENAPSVLVIDEMEAYLADRSMGSGASHHRVEEVAEFLRRIPEASKAKVLIVAMTNRVDMIDPAILRRGRFDHVISVDYASPDEVLDLLTKLLETLPTDKTVDVSPIARKLAGRPLSDVAFVVREGSRLAARARADKLAQTFLLAALDSTPSRVDDSPRRRIGFV